MSDAKSLEIFLIRHGQTDWNREQRIMGARPIPLNVMGIQQSEAMGRVLKTVKLKAIYSSPLRRALQTAKAIARGSTLKVVEAPEVQEINYGQWVGKKFSEVKNEPAYLTYHSSPRDAEIPGGEKMEDVHRRAVGFIETLRKRHKEGKVVVVSHADVIKTILVHYLDLSLNDILKIRIDNASLSILHFNGMSTRILGMNCHSHLDRLFTDRAALPTKSKKKR